MLNFQDIILKLHHFWASRGCLIWQPYNQVVGAGTMNPATFLRVLGPEPWNVAYVEPSARPDDGRFGENPNRLYTHTQYQVILKPSPERSQEIYLASLDAIGVDRSKHDVRFVEDNWAQPTIGAWGLGWEVWLDGLEITQYTYFQQVGGVTLDPVCLEITYGLERIAMALQGARSVFDLKWDDVRTYGDVKLQDEVERSSYAFKYADVEELHELFEVYEREGQRALGYGMVLPAHDYVLQCSNVFNLLDTRGAIGVTERQRYVGRMRTVAEQVAKAYVAQREQAGFPWMSKEEGRRMKDEKESSITSSFILHPSSFILEIGTEELPADNVAACEKQLRDRLTTALDEARIDHGEVTTIATPRRTAAIVKNVAPAQRPLDELVRGPGAKAAFDKDGKPTQAAIGFAGRFGLEPKDLIVKEDGKASYVYARKREEGKPAAEVLAQVLPQVLGKITFEKTMRWNASNVAFSRPINWIVALLGDQTVPFEFAGVRSGAESTGSRGMGSPRFVVDHADHYESLLAEHHILGDLAARRAEVKRQIDAAAATVGGRVAENADLLDEVTNLVEQPAALVCSFEREFLDLPAPILISVMSKKQRYFTVLDLTPDPSPKGRGEQATLLPHFITVRNGPNEDMDEVRKGNEDVVRARFADAAYFFRDDVQKPLDSFLTRLDTITFQAKLGSMLDKAKRIEALVEPIAGLLTDDGRRTTDPDDTADSSVVGHPSSVLSVARAAARLCKADLATSMVVEITALQGVMGREYYLRQHPGRTPEDVAIADAIFEHYLPRYAGDKNPATLPGLIVGLADKLDSIAGLFAVGLAPKGSADPFALRRAAIGIVQNLVAAGQSFSIRKGLQQASWLLPVKISPDALNAAHTFIVERERQQLLDEGYRYDVVDAVVAEQGDNPHRARLNIDQLAAWVQRDGWDKMLAAYSRSARIIKSAGTHVDGLHLGGGGHLDAPLDPEPVSQALLGALDGLPAAPYRNVDEMMGHLSKLVEPITVFFDKVLVMAEDEALRRSRLALVARVVALAKGLADLSKLEGF